MKQKYLQPIERELQSDAFGLYFNHKPYLIDPLNFEKRVRVFIEQLLVDIVREAKTVADIEFAIIQLGRHQLRFVPRLIKEKRYRDADKVQGKILLTKAILSIKLEGAKRNESRKSHYEPTKQNI